VGGPAGIKAVAARAGVSVGTVSNVLNRPHLVRPQTRARVEKAMAELGFVRNESARQLRAGRSRVLAYVLMDTGNPFFTDVAHGAEESAREHGLALVLHNSGGEPAREDDHLSLLLEQRVHGVLVTTVDEAGGHLRRMQQLGVPVVLVDRPASAGPDWCSVGVDDVHGGRIATDHLLGHGHERIAFIGDAGGLPQFRDRLAGAREAFRAAGRDPDRLLTVGDRARIAGDGREAARELLARPLADRPTGVVCGNDLIALGMLQEVLRAGLRVPDDLAIVGYDDISYVASAAVPLSSVRQPRDLLGRTAVDLLLAEAGGGPGHVHRQVEFTPQLVVRRSTDPAG
jgi:LacI family transcriptional regulator